MTENKEKKQETFTFPINKDLEMEIKKRCSKKGEKFIIPGMIKERFVKQSNISDEFLIKINIESIFENKPIGYTKESNPIYELKSSKDKLKQKYRKPSQEGKFFLVTEQESPLIQSLVRVKEKCFETTTEEYYNVTIITSLGEIKESKSRKLDISKAKEMDEKTFLSLKDLIISMKNFFKEFTEKFKELEK